MIKQMFKASLLAVSLSAASFSYADAVSDFYQGKTVSVVSPSGVGGSIYKYALLVSNHIGRHIPGAVKKRPIMCKTRHPSQEL